MTDTCAKVNDFKDLEAMKNVHPACIQTYNGKRRELTLQRQDLAEKRERAERKRKARILAQREPAFEGPRVDRRPLSATWGKNGWGGGDEHADHDLGGQFRPRHTHTRREEERYYSNDDGASSSGSEEGDDIFDVPSGVAGDNEQVKLVRKGSVAYRESLTAEARERKKRAARRRSRNAAAEEFHDIGESKKSFKIGWNGADAVLVMPGSDDEEDFQKVRKQDSGDGEQVKEFLNRKYELGMNEPASTEGFEAAMNGDGPDTFELPGLDLERENVRDAREQKERRIKRAKLDASGQMPRERPPHSVETMDVEDAIERMQRGVSFFDRVSLQEVMDPETGSRTWVHMYGGNPALLSKVDGHLHGGDAKYKYCVHWDEQSETATLRTLASTDDRCPSVTESIGDPKGGLSVKFSCQKGDGDDNTCSGISINLEYGRGECHLAILIMVKILSLGGKYKNVKRYTVNKVCDDDAAKSLSNRPVDALTFAQMTYILAARKGDGAEISNRFRAELSKNVDYEAYMLEKKRQSIADAQRQEEKAKKSLEERLQKEKSALDELKELDKKLANEAKRKVDEAKRRQNDLSTVNQEKNVSDEDRDAAVENAGVATTRAAKAQRKARAAKADVEAQAEEVKDAEQDLENFSTKCAAFARQCEAGSYVDIGKHVKDCRAEIVGLTDKQMIKKYSMSKTNVGRCETMTRLSADLIEQESKKQTAQAPDAAAPVGRGRSNVKPVNYKV